MNITIISGHLARDAKLTKFNSLVFTLINNESTYFNGTEHQHKTVVTCFLNNESRAKGLLAHMSTGMSITVTGRLDTCDTKEGDIYVTHTKLVVKDLEFNGPAKSHATAPTTTVVKPEIIAAAEVSAALSQATIVPAATVPTAEELAY